MDSLGVVVGGMVYCFDSDVMTGPNWFSAGIFIGTCGFRFCVRSQLPDMSGTKGKQAASVTFAG